jgi:uncharacterized membrane protein
VTLFIFGFILLVFGILLQIFPPDYYTQRFYGYRTVKSQRDETSWVKANKLAAKYLIILAFGNLLTGLILTEMRTLSDTFLQVVTACIIGVTVILIFFLVEKQL